MPFFDYESPYRTNRFIQLNFAEFTIPFIVLIVLIGIIVYYKDFLRKNVTLDRYVRYISATLLIVLYSSHYLLRFAIYGLDTLILPFQLCAISMFLAIVLLFNQNRTIYTFVLYAGVLGGLISLITPVIGYDSHYYRYYQFYGAHLLLILTPLYYLIVKSYYPTKKETINAFLILQSLAIFMGAFNYYMGTDFMFIFIDPEKLTKFPVIANFGGIPYYLLFVELTGIALFAGFYRVTKFINKLHQKNIMIQYKEA